MNALERLARALQQREEKQRRGYAASQRRGTITLRQALLRVTRNSWFSQADGDNSERFDGNLDSAPSGWTVSAAPSSAAQYCGWWNIYMNGEGAWAYYHQGAINVEADTPVDTYSWFRWGAVAWDDRAWSCDLSYQFGVCADTAGAPDTNNCVRVVLEHDYTGGAGWRVRGEQVVAGTQTAGNWIVLNTAPLVMPLWFTLRLWHVAPGTVQWYWGTVPGSVQSVWSSASGVTFGQAHWYLAGSRGAGDDRQSILALTGVDAQVN